MGRRVTAIGLAGALAVLAGPTGCSQQTPEGAERITDYSQVGDCLQPARDRSERFLQASCDGPEATVEIVDMVTDQGDPGGESSPVCPPGTDRLVESEQGPVDDGEIAAPPQTWCLRNLEAPHPGDPGKGGGELHPDDCFTIDTTGGVAEEPCGGGGAADRYRLLAVEELPGACPAGAVEPVELDGLTPRVLCASPL